MKTAKTVRKLTKSEGKSVSLRTGKIQKIGRFASFFHNFAPLFQIFGHFYRISTLFHEVEDSIIANPYGILLNDRLLNGTNKRRQPNLNQGDTFGPKTNQTDHRPNEALGAY